MRSKLYLFISIFLFLNTVVLLHSLSLTRDFMLSVTTLFFVLLHAALILLLYKKKRTITFYVAAATATVIIEIIGVKTGLIFGEYTYGETFDLQLFGAPIMIGFNWVMLNFGAFAIAKKYLKKNYILLGALLCVFLDIFIEQVAIRLDYWNWEGFYPPFQNYIAWFVISLAIQYCISKFSIEYPKKVFSIIYLSVLYFMIIMTITFYV